MSRHYVITQVVPKLLKRYSRGNHRPIFGLQVLAHLQSERDLSLGFSFVDDDFRLVIGFKRVWFMFWWEGGKGMFSSREAMHSEASFRPLGMESGSRTAGAFSSSQEEQGAR